MKNRYLRGNTALNDSWTLPSGMLSIDTERKAVRFHDGVTQGGFEMVGARAYIPPVGPGPTELIAGDDQLGWYGEAAGSELITYGELSSAIGLSSGTLQHDAESIWLKFAYQGKILYIAKKPIRHTVSWNILRGIDAVYDDILAPTIQIGQDTLRVTLMTGGNGDPSTAAGGEWNDLMYRVHVDDPTGTHWASYSDADIVVGSGDGCSSFVQERISNADYAIHRGSSSLTDYMYDGINYPRAHKGWRPCLRLVT